ncbi:hypothetical protein BDQ17DRAFT_1188267, partial [Cyathus striatus]
VYVLHFTEDPVLEPDEYHCTQCQSEGNPTLKICTGCRKVRYCSEECQKTDWKRHKKECK